MHIHDPSHRPTSPRQEAVRQILDAAKRLHRSAASEALSQSLPVLRRILASGVLHGLSLPQLRRQRELVQRKHVLRTLAIEAGYPSWEAYRGALAQMGADELAQFDVVRLRAGYPNAWFSTFSEAQAHAAAHGGRAVQVGLQGVVLLEPPSNSAST